MIGYSPELIVGVWTGYDDNQPIGSSQAAKLIWRDAIEAGHKKMGAIVSLLHLELSRLTLTHRLVYYQINTAPSAG